MDIDYSMPMLERSNDNILYKNKINYKDNDTACLLRREEFWDTSVVSTPLFQVLSVSLKTSDRNHEIEEVLRIYGSIWVTNNHGDITIVYKRSVDDPEIINDPWDSLQLQGVEDHVIVPCSLIIVHLELFVENCSNNVIPVRDKFTFDYTCNDYDYSKYKNLKMGVNSKYSFELNCASFPFAVAAEVQAIYSSNLLDYKRETFGEDYKFVNEALLGESDLNSKYGDVKEEDVGDAHAHAHVFGNITASIYDDFRNSHLVTLVNRSIHEKPIKVKCGCFIKLSRCFVVVPSYSTLKVNVNIWDHNQKSKISAGIVKFFAQDDHIYKWDIVGENGCIRIRVEWHHFGKDLKQGCHRLSIALAPEVRTWYMDYGGTSLLEVFSVVIFSYDDDDDDDDDGKLCVHGKVEVDDYIYALDHGLIIYKREEDNPLTSCSSGTIIPIVCTTKAVSSLDYLSIFVILKDKDGGNFINGAAHWNSSAFSRMYDRRLCSIIRGDRGFAAVNYMAINDALRAIVLIKLYTNLKDDNCATKICGQIVARYGNYSYSTQHEKRLYQSVVFDSCEELISPSPEGVTLPLLKPLVVFPRTSSLIFEICLNVVPILEDLSLHIFKEEVEFSIYDGEISRRIIRGDGEYWMQINIEFSNYRF